MAKIIFPHGFPEYIKIGKNLEADLKRLFKRFISGEGINCFYINEARYNVDPDIYHGIAIQHYGKTYWIQKDYVHDSALHSRFGKWKYMFEENQQ